MEVKCSGISELRSIRICFPLLAVLASVFRLGQARIRSTVLCCCFEAAKRAEVGYGLPENKQIVQTMYRLGRKALPLGYQLNDRGLVE